MLTCYCDESGTHTGGTYGPSTVVCIAGAIAPVEQWELLAKEWREALDKHGIDCFHMTEFATRPRRKPFEALTDAEANLLFFDRLVPLINNRVHVGFGVAFPIAAYNAVAADLSFVELVGSPYEACTALFVNRVGEWAKQRKETEPIAFVFDQNADHYPAMRASFEFSKNDPSYPFANLLGSIVSDSRRRMLPLQVADILAYQTYRYTRSVLQGRPRVRRELNAILPGRFRILEIEEETLTAFWAEKQIKH
jgi:hypothetical protein